MHQWSCLIKILFSLCWEFRTGTLVLNRKMRISALNVLILPSVHQGENLPSCPGSLAHREMFLEMLTELCQAVYLCVIQLGLHSQQARAPAQVFISTSIDKVKNQQNTVTVPKLRRTLWSCARNVGLNSGLATSTSQHIKWRNSL